MSKNEPQVGNSINTDNGANVSGNNMTSIETQININFAQPETKNEPAEKAPSAVNKPEPDEGNEPYLFISYSSKDKDEVYPIIEQLQSRGVRLWYDEGIDPAENFRTVIAPKIKECHIFVALFSENFYQSNWCPKEFDFAFKNQKKILAIVIDDQPVRDDFDLIMSGDLMIRKSQYQNPDDFYSKIMKTAGIDQCITKPAATSKPNPKKASHGKMPQIITNSVPTHPSVHFLGRETALQEIKALAKDKIVLLNGIGGIGKTEICRRIFWDYRKNPADGIEYLGWIFYENSLASSLSGKFPEIKETDPESCKEAVQRLIEEYGDRLLLFVDNANELYSDEKTDDKKWLNSLSCRMILTSRTEIKCFDQYRIDTLSPEQCRSVYQQNSEDNDPESIPFIDEIIRHAAYHTQTVELLARTQAASCMTAEELMNELNKHGFTLENVLETVDSSHADTSSDQRLIEHLAMIFDIAQIRDDEAIRILKLFSLLATNIPIDADMIKYIMQIKSLNAVNDLVRHGWLNKSGRMFSIHPVIAETVQYKCKPDYDFAEPLIEALTVALYISSGKGVDVQNILLPHCVAVEKAFHGTETKSFARFLDKIAMIMQETGDYTRALTYLDDAVNAAEKANGTEHPNTATTYNNIGLLYNDMGEYDKALEYYNKALAVKEKVLGPEHPDTAATYNNIASVYYSKGEYNMSLEYYSKALLIVEKVQGTKHPNTATTYNNIAFVYLDMGDYGKALEYYNKALVIVEKVLGTEHPNTAATYNSIAFVYLNMGEYDKALEYNKKSLAIHEKLLGTEHPDTAKAYNNIGLLYNDMGEYDKALEYYKKAMTINEKLLGTEHPSIATIYNNIATVYDDMGDYDNALEYCKKALAIREKVLGTEHPDTLITYRTLADIYQALGDTEKAAEYRKKAGE